MRSGFSSIMFFITVLVLTHSVSAQKSVTAADLNKRIQGWKAEAAAWREAHGFFPKIVEDKAKPFTEENTVATKFLSSISSSAKRDPGLDAYIKACVLTHYKPDLSKLSKTQLFQVINALPKPKPIPQPTGSSLRQINAAQNTDVPTATIDSVIKPLITKLQRARDVARAQNDPIFFYRRLVALNMPRLHGARLHAMILNAFDRYQATEWPRRYDENPIETIQDEARKSLSEEIEVDDKTRQAMYGALDSIRKMMPTNSNPGPAYDWTIEGSRVKALSQSKDIYKIDNDPEARLKRMLQYIVEQRL